MYFNLTFFLLKRVAVAKVHQIGFRPFFPYGTASNSITYFTGKVTSFFPRRRCHFAMSVFSSVNNCIEIKIQKMMKKPSFYAFDKNYVTFH